MELEQSILNAFFACLQHDLSTRAEGEKFISQIKTQNGFISALFKIIVNANHPIELRQLAAVFLKQEVYSNWADFTYNSKTKTRQRIPCKYSPEEQEFIKQHIINGIVHTPKSLRLQLGIVFGTIVTADFPQNWPNLLREVVQTFQSTQVSTIESSLYCLRIICQKFQAIQKDKILHTIISDVFPILYPTFEAISQFDNEESAAVQVLFCKIFHSAVYTGVPPFLLQDNAFLRWMNLLIGLFTKTVTIENMPASITDLPKNPKWLVKKWTIQIFHRIFSLYSELSKKPSNHDVQFQKQFLNFYAVNIQNAILAQLSILRSSSGYLPPKVISFSFHFLEISMQKAHTYQALKTNLKLLLEEILFPVLYFTEEDRITWESDPEETIREEHDLIHASDYTPKRNALSFLYNLFTFRTKENLLEFIQFVVGKLNQNIQEKYAALTIFCTLAAKIKKLDAFKAGLESFLLLHVIPELKSPHGFIRSKACWTFSLYSDLEFANVSVFNQGLQGVVECLKNDPDLPVRVTAGIGLRFVMANDAAEPLIAPHLQDILQLYLDLLTEIDHDEIISTLESIIQKYRDQIAPHAFSLLQNFWQAFDRICHSEESESTGLAALECLKAILVVLTSIKDRPELFPTVESFLLPRLKVLIGRNNMEYFEDFTRIISCFAHYSPFVSDHLWELFVILHDAFNTWAFDFLPNILISMDNIISADPEAFVKRNHISLVYHMFQKTLGKDANCGDDLRIQHAIECLQVNGCQLMEVGLQNGRGHADDWLPGIIESVIRRFQRPFAGIALPTVLFNIVGNCFFYNPLISLTILERNNWSNFLFERWFKFFEHFSRLYDRKVTILGISSIFAVPSDQWPAAFKAGFKQIFVSCLNVLRDLDRLRTYKAEHIDEESEEATYDSNSLVDFVKSAYEKQERTGDGYNSDEDIDACPSTLERAMANVDALDDVDELEDEDEVTTPIDSINEIVFFFDRLNDLNGREQGLFAGLLLSLDAQEKNLLSDLTTIKQQQQQAQ